MQFDPLIQIRRCYKFNAGAYFIVCNLLASTYLLEILTFLLLYVSPITPRMFTTYVFC